MTNSKESDLVKVRSQGKIKALDSQDENHVAEGPSATEGSLSKQTQTSDLGCATLHSQHFPTSYLLEVLGTLCLVPTRETCTESVLVCFMFYVTLTQARII